MGFDLIAPEQLTLNEFTLWNLRGLGLTILILKLDMSGSGSNIAHLSPEDIAKWPAPNYENPDRLTWMPAYSSIWFIAATLLFGMRCWLRVRGHAGRLGLDDVRKHETGGRKRAELTYTAGDSPTGLARWIVVHSGHNALLGMGWIPPCLGY